MGKPLIRNMNGATITQGDGWAPATQALATIPSTGDLIDVSTLLGGRRSIRLAHANAIYRLSLTRLNKLILTREVE